MKNILKRIYALFLKKEKKTFPLQEKRLKMPSVCISDNLIIKRTEMANISFRRNESLKYLMNILFSSIKKGKKPFLLSPQKIRLKKNGLKMWTLWWITEMRWKIFICFLYKFYKFISVFSSTTKLYFWKCFNEFTYSCNSFRIFY